MGTAHNRRDRLILASASPRRAALLRAAGYVFEVRPPALAESTRPGERASRSAERLAREKARQVATRLTSRARATVLAADTVVARGRWILGKPADEKEARWMLRMLSGQTHRVVTGVAVCGAKGGRLRSSSSVTSVTFKPLSRREIDWYVGSGDAYDKAGAYGIQGAAGLFVTGIRGSYSNVVGLPMELVYAYLGLPA